MTQEQLKFVTRRQFFGRCAVGIGGLALTSLLNEKLFASVLENPLAPKQPHLKPRAKRAIYLHMAGAPSHLRRPQVPCDWNCARLDDRYPVRPLHCSVLRLQRVEPEDLVLGAADGELRARFRDHRLDSSRRAITAAECERCVEPPKLRPCRRSQGRWRRPPASEAARTAE